MQSTKTLILSGYGLNCEKETLYCCKVAGGSDIEVQHLSHLIEGKLTLQDYRFLIFIGGFLDGDDLGAGRIGANRFKHITPSQHASLRDQLAQFIDGDNLVLGICNGFQVMVKLGILPGALGAVHPQQVSLTANDCGRFEDRWVHLNVDAESSCIFTRGIDRIELPIRHGEGRIEATDEGVLRELVSQHQVPFKYADSQGQITCQYPANPNGSLFGIAALCNPKGTVMGMMPHPEAYNHYTNHPQWTRRSFQTELGDGVKLFQNAYRYLLES